MKILITGGHITPALAVIEELKGDEIVFVGRKYALESEQTLSFEYKEITNKNIKFINLTTGKLNRGHLLLNLKSFLRMPVGFYQAFSIIKKEKPQAVLTFGSYLALPVAWWAYIFNIPLFLHEQTSIPGRSARIIGRFAQKIFVSFPQTENFFPKHKAYLTGNPVRKGVFNVVKKPFPIDQNLPIVYVTGGSLGSHSINLHIERLLQRLLKKYTIIHQTGDTKQYDDYERLKKLRETLPEEYKKRYILRKHFSEDEVGFVYSVSVMIVGRAGANTFFELIMLEKPAVFIPLPWSAEKEQQKQAEIFKSAGVGEIFLQSDESDNLLIKIQNVIGNISSYKSNFKSLKKIYKENAARTIAEEIRKS